MKKIFLIIIAGILLAMPMAGFATVSDFGAENLKTAVGAPYGNNDNLSKSISNIIGAVLALAGTIFLVLMVYGGITWMTAMGNSDKVEKSKEIIIAAVIGAAITASAYAITFFVMDRLSKGGGGANVEQSSQTITSACKADTDCIAGEKCFKKNFSDSDGVCL